MVWSSFVLALLTACGGSGGSDEVGKCYNPNPSFCASLGVAQSTPTPSAVGLYKGVASNGRAVAAFILSDNSFYAVYSGTNNPVVTGGAIQGTIRTEAGTFSVTDAIDVSLERLGTQFAAIKGSYGPKQFLEGSITYPASNETITFSANYNSDFDSTPSLTVIAGTYSGTSGTSAGAEKVTLHISGNGDMTGSGTSGCQFSGTLKPLTTGNAYVTQVKFGASPCAFPGSILSGISYFDHTSNLVYTIASIPSLSGEFLLVANKQ